MDLHVVLVAPRNPLNIGAAARAMANFGFTRLHLVNPYEVAYREARSGIGAGAVLEGAKEFARLEDAVADCSMVVGTTSAGGRELQHPLRRLEVGARLMKKHSGAVALLFGSEKFGLSNSDMSHCHWLMRIPTVDVNHSMNLGQAVAVCLYELVRETRAADTPERFRGATASDLEQITRMLLEVLTESGYLNPATVASSRQKIRRLVRRYPVAAADAPLLLGILRQILWRFRAHGHDVI